MHALYRPALNGRKASDWLRSIPCQWEGNKLPKVRTNQAVDTRPEFTCLSILPAIPSSQRGSSHVSSQGKEAALVTHDIYDIKLSKCY